MAHWERKLPAAQVSLLPALKDHRYLAFLLLLLPFFRKSALCKPSSVLTLGHQAANTLVTLCRIIACC